MAYQAEAEVNWDPVDKTVLANEQVDVNGKSWRSGAKVEKRTLKQWFMRITAFREALLNDLKHLAQDGMWPERVLAMQRNWIGRSKGARVKFPIIGSVPDMPAELEVFTTRPETLCGVQYVAIAATHPLVLSLAKSDPDLQAYLNAVQSQPAGDSSHDGYLLQSVSASNPITKFDECPIACRTPLPVYVARYVLGNYGVGAVMGVPAHDARDYSFWKANQPSIPARQVIATTPTCPDELPFLGAGFLSAENGVLAGLPTEVAAETIVKMLESVESGAATDTWRLRDWLISRQRYWGTPIPIIHCEQCGPVDVPESDLPVVLPSIGDVWQTSERGNILENATEWGNVSCPKCNGPAKRDTDTMDTFVDSSWYYMRFPDLKDTKNILSSEATKDFLPVDIYVGGVEHAILHLLYARFISKFMATTPLWPEGREPHIKGEPFKQLITQGMVHGKTYVDQSSGKFLKPNEVNLSDPTMPTIMASGEAATVTYEKMSKSKHNGVDPIDCISRYGADATRAHILFQAPVREVLNWDESKISGVTRWLKRVYDYVEKANMRWNRQIGVESEDQHPAQYFLLNRPMYDAVAAGDISSVIPLFEAEASLLKKAPLRRQKADIVKMLANHERLWQHVQQTIISTTESYSKTFALNTIVSDLMALTNTILEADQIDFLLGGALSRPWLLRQSTKALVQMMAPITPTLSQQCWARIHNLKVTAPKAAIVFSSPFPTPDGTLDLLKPRTRKLAVQVNGKLRCVIDVPIVARELSPKDLDAWIKKQVLASDVAMKRLHENDVATADRVIVVRGGELVNFIIKYPLSGDGG